MLLNYHFNKGSVAWPRSILARVLLGKIGHEHLHHNLEVWISLQPFFLPTLLQKQVFWHYSQAHYPSRSPPKTCSQGNGWHILHQMYSITASFVISRVVGYKILSLEPDKNLKLSWIYDLWAMILWKIANIGVKFTSHSHRILQDWNAPCVLVLVFWILVSPIQWSWWNILEEALENAVYNSLCKLK